MSDETQSAYLAGVQAALKFPHIDPTQTISDPWNADPLKADKPTELNLHWNPPNEDSGGYWGQSPRGYGGHHKCNEHCETYALERLGLKP